MQRMCEESKPCVKVRRNFACVRELEKENDEILKKIKRESKRKGQKGDI